LRIEAVMRDVTERKKLEDQSRDVFHQLSQAEKLAALGQTMSGVAHAGDHSGVRRAAHRQAAG
jgi:phosphoglycerate-specific signal transduction histidine kinase